MPYCPNPECKHKKRTGKPAEYREGQARCSDCGSDLVAENPTPPKEKPPCPKPLKKRLLFTLGMMAAAWLAFLIPPPLVNLDALQAAYHWSVFDASLHFGPFALGIKSFLAGFVLVEVIALVIPRLRRRRHGHPRLRRKLVVASLITGLIITVIQSLFLARQMQNIYLGGWDIPQVVENPGWQFLVGMSLVLTAGSCLLLGAAMLISRRGVGNGILVILLAGSLFEVPHGLSTIWYLLATGQSSVPRLAVVLIVMAGFAWGIWWFLHQREKRSGKLTLRLPTCGTLPMEVFVVLAMLPNTLYFLIHAQWLSDLGSALVPGSMVYLITGLVTLAIFTFLASGMFYWRRRAIHRAPENRREWLWARLFSGGLMVAMLLGWHVVDRLGDVWQDLFPGSLTLLVGVALVADLRHEIRARWMAPGGADLEVLSVHQDVPEAIEAADQNAVQGVFFRSLAYFFGPYVPLKVLGISLDPAQKQETSA